MQPERYVLPLWSKCTLFAHRTNYYELDWIVSGGMTPTHALLAATALNAKIIRMQDEVGCIVPGLRRPNRCQRRSDTGHQTGATCGLS